MGKPPVIGFVAVNLNLHAVKLASLRNHLVYGSGLMVMNDRYCILCPVKLELHSPGLIHSISISVYGNLNQPVVVNAGISDHVALNHIVNAIQEELI